MEEEFPNDPRYRPMQPAPEEIEAWAGREHKRRQAWLAGPTEAEKQDWARRYRRRALFGLEESRLAPTAGEIEAWADREHKRRQAWLAGPTEEEKRDWARRYSRGSMTGFEPRPAPTAEEVEAWAEREKERRREWLAGPSEEEKRQWVRREAGGFPGDWMRFPPIEPALPETAQRLLREAELAGKGSLYALLRAPAALWSYFVRAGRALEEESSSREPRRTRVPY